MRKWQNELNDCKIDALSFFFKDNSEQTYTSSLLICSDMRKRLRKYALDMTEAFLSAESIKPRPARPAPAPK